MNKIITVVELVAFVCLVVGAALIASPLGFLAAGAILLFITRQVSA